MRAYALLLATAVMLAGCESREAKLDRLRTEESIARLNLLMWERRADSLEADMRSRMYDLPLYDSIARLERFRAVSDSQRAAGSDTIMRNLSRARNQLDLVQADIRKLLR